MPALSMTIEPVAPFNGLDVLVARDDGLFEAEGLDLRFASRPGGMPQTQDGTPNQPMTNQGSALERGNAAMFQA
jgi:hypothetical protein